MSLRAYNRTDENSFGNLYAASDVFYNYILTCEDVFQEYFAVLCHSINLTQTLIKHLKHVSLPDGICKDYPLEAMLKFFCKVRINYVIKFSNRQFLNSAKKQRKLFKIQSF